MGLHHNPKIVTDGLVLYLDAANIKSFRGEPTTNIFPYPMHQHLSPGAIGALGGWAGSVDWAGTYEVINASLPLGIDQGIIIKCTQPNVYYTHGSISLTTGNSYTISAWLKTTSSVSSNHLHISSPTILSINDADITQEWVRRSYTFNCTSTGTYGVTTYNYVAGCWKYVAGIQVEQKTYSTHFIPTNTTRGTTVATGGGTVDLSGNDNSGELINGPTYDSDNGGSLVFDGTDDTIQILDNTFIQATSSMTWSFIVKPTSTSNYRPVFLKGTPGLSTGFINVWLEVNSLRFRVYASDGTNTLSYFSFTTTIDTYVFVDVIYDGAYVWFYKNGVYSDKSQLYNYGFGTNSGPLIIGEFYTYAAKWNGNISNFKVYNRALTQEEITQNFNTLKGRYGL